MREVFQTISHNIRDKHSRFDEQPEEAEGERPRPAEPDMDEYRGYTDFWNGWLCGYLQTRWEVAREVRAWKKGLAQARLDLEAEKAKAIRQGRASLWTEYEDGESVQILPISKNDLPPPFDRSFQHHSRSIKRVAAEFWEREMRRFESTKEKVEAEAEAEAETIAILSESEEPQEGTATLRIDCPVRTEEWLLELAETADLLKINGMRFKPDGQREIKWTAKSKYLADVLNRLFAMNPAPT